MTTPRFIVYIDGYNFYRAIKKNATIPIHLGWCDFSKLARTFLIGARGSLVSVKYFTARVGRLGDRGGELGGEAGRQQRWLDAAATIHGLEIVEGSFRGDPNAKRPSQARKEKQTDINIAVHMVSDALRDQCDYSLLVSADHDFVPALQAVKRGGKCAEMWLPPGHNAGTLAALEADGIRVRQISTDMLKGSRLPDEIQTTAGMIEAPKSWRRS